jgi:hypothetical protein
MLLLNSSACLPRNKTDQSTDPSETNMARRLFVEFARESFDAEMDDKICTIERRECKKPMNPVETTYVSRSISKIDSNE